MIQRNTISSNKKYGIFLGFEINFLTNSEYNTVYKNNFIKNKIGAFINKYIGEIKTDTNKWDNNYWDRPRVAPKLILGSFITFIGKLLLPLIPIVDFDLHPTQEPYDISMSYLAGFI